MNEEVWPTKVCTKCKVDKEYRDYYFVINSKGAKTRTYKSECKECTKARVRKYHSDDPIRSAHTRWKYDLQKNYGMTESEWESLLALQGGGCGICGEKETNVHKSGTVWRLSVDHCHDTGKIRGILCNNCNRAIGLLKDNVQLLRKAADYLER
jgi:hypothetical protein